MEKRPVLTDTERRLLNEVQAGLPIASEPYKVLGKGLGITEADVLEMLKRFKEAGYIRRMGAIFDSRRLGYVSTLCAIKVSEEQKDEVAAYINSLNEVTHNYLREHDYNMWFTVIAPSREKIDSILKEIEAQFDVDVLDLPATRFFKINVSFNFQGGMALNADGTR